MGMTSSIGETSIVDDDEWMNDHSSNLKEEVV